MTKFSLAIECAYCDEELDVELRHGDTLVVDEYHSCLGERPGVVGMVFDGKVVCSGAGHFRVVVSRD